MAVVAILAYFDFEIPEYLENLVKTSVETGAALAGTLQTENIGLEKVITNIVANPNIRYIILCGRESPGHLTGEAVITLMKNGVDEKRKIIGTDAPHPVLYNITMESIDRFRKQISLINLLNEVDQEINQERRLVLLSGRTHRIYGLYCTPSGGLSRTANLQ